MVTTFGLFNAWDYEVGGAVFDGEPSFGFVAGSYAGLAFVASRCDADLLWGGWICRAFPMHARSFGTVAAGEVVIDDCSIPICTFEVAFGSPWGGVAGSINDVPTVCRASGDSSAPTPRISPRGQAIEQHTRVASSSGSRRVAGLGGGGTFTSWSPPCRTTSFSRSLSLSS